MEIHIMKDTTPPKGTLLFFYDRTSDFDVSSPSSLPGSLKWTVYPEFVDIDGDGDLDMFLDQKFTLNNGTRNRPDFNYLNPISDSYGLPSAGSNANLADIGALGIPSAGSNSALADIDGDGDLDAFISDGDVATGVYLNQGDRHNPMFGSAVKGAYGLPQVSGHFIHDLADLDADGDLDALFGDSAGQLQIYLNEGTPRSPVFGAAVPGAYGLPTKQGRLYLTDIDRDGDLDVLNANGFIPNEGTANKPSFGAENGLSPLDAFASLADLDGDGDLDAFIGFGKFGTRTIRTYTNIGTPVPITKFDTGSGNYGVGSTISMTVSFSEPVIVTGGPQLRLNTGMAKYTSGSGTDTLHFTYTVQAGDKSSSLDYESAAALTLNGGTIRDAAGNNAILTLATPGTAGSLRFKTREFDEGIVIDTVSPRATSVSSPAADGMYKAGDNIDVQVQFGEAVTVTGSPQLRLETGWADRAVNYTSGSGTNTLTFRYTVQAGDTSADLDYTGYAPLTLNGGSIKATKGGLDAILTLPGHGQALADNKALVINTDTLAPHGTLMFASPPLVNPYKLPNMGSDAYPHFADIDDDGDFDAIVGTNWGEIRIYLNLGTPSKPEFGPAVVGSYGLPDYVVSQAHLTLGDIDADGDLDVLVVTPSETQVYLNTGTASKPGFGAAVVDGYGLSQHGRYFPALPTLADIDGDGDLDALLGYIGLNSGLEIVPNIGTPTHPVFQDDVIKVNFLSGLSNRYFNFPALVDIDGDGLLDALAGGEDVPSFYLNVGSSHSPVFDQNLGTLGLTIPSRDALLRDGYNQLSPAFVDIDHDGDVDVFIGNSLGDLLLFPNIGALVAPVTSPTPQGKYGAGSVIALSVAFSEPVFVTGTPQIKLETGKVDRAANYISGSGTSTLNFSYTVQAGDTSADLDYQSAAALALNGGSIHDAAGNEATFTLATPGALGSLGASSAIVIDGRLSLSLVGYTPDLAAGSFFWF
jgi:hypothetical protein